MVFLCSIHLFFLLSAVHSIVSSIVQRTFSAAQLLFAFQLLLEFFLHQVSAYLLLLLPVQVAAPPIKREDVPEAAPLTILSPFIDPATSPQPPTSS